MTRPLTLPLRRTVAAALRQKLPAETQADWAWLSGLLMTALLLAALLVGTPAHAQVAQAKGTASLAYNAKAAPADTKDKALRAAQLKALEYYFAEAGEAESANFDASRAQLESQLDQFVLSTTVLNEEDNQAAQRYAVSVRVEFNVARLRNALKASSAVGRTARADKSSLAFVFVARELDSQTVFDARVYKRTENASDGSNAASTDNQTHEGEAVRKSQVSTTASTQSAASAQTHAVTTTEMGGSTTRRASQSTWRLYPTSALNQVFTQAFTTAGFRVQEAAFLDAVPSSPFHIAAVQNDYRAGNDLQPATLQAVAAGMRAASVPYVALGTLDVGLPDADPQTGLQRVSVTVNARVLDVTAAVPETLVSVGPTVFAGRGPTEDEARTNALKLAAASAARELASQLNAQGVH